MPHVTIPGETDLQLYYEDSGGDGRPVVLIHGWPLSAEAWAAQVPALTGAGHRVIAYDRRGFGRSSKPDGGYDYDTMADDLDALLTHLDLTDAVLVGFSMGGGEVARYIGNHGESRLAGAVLAAAITPALCITDDNPDGGMPMEGFTGLRDECAADREGFLKKFMTWFFSNPNDLAISDEQFAEVLTITEQGSDRALQDTIIAWATDFRDDVAKFSVPTLVIHGDSDNNVPFPPSGRRAHEMIAGSQLVVVEGGPHGINVSHTDQFNAALLEFLASLD
ncbi:alpha/beta fold hydrolase [Aestuariimicrobium sp. Y1814]|uniref:alpha/beta fold hydrolase n=1 Tax=Aestuariimicrobium sp. Y1814 TaxID=3418742 RepID=UPI003DA726B7